MSSIASPQSITTAGTSAGRSADTVAPAVVEA